MISIGTTVAGTSVLALLLVFVDLSSVTFDLRRRVVGTTVAGTSVLALLFPYVESVDLMVRVVELSLLIFVGSSADFGDIVVNIVLISFLMVPLVSSLSPIVARISLLLVLLPFVECSVPFLIANLTVEIFVLLIFCVLLQNSYLCQTLFLT